MNKLTSDARDGFLPPAIYVISYRELDKCIHATTE